MKKSKKVKKHTPRLSREVYTKLREGGPLTSKKGKKGYTRKHNRLNLYD
jgi:hypothetical protein